MSTRAGFCLCARRRSYLQLALVPLTRTTFVFHVCQIFSVHNLESAVLDLQCAHCVLPAVALTGDLFCAAGNRKLLCCCCKIGISHAPGDGHVSCLRANVFFVHLLSAITSSTSKSRDSILCNESDILLNKVVLYDPSLNPVQLLIAFSVTVSQNSSNLLPFEH